MVVLMIKASSALTFPHSILPLKQMSPILALSSFLIDSMSLSEILVESAGKAGSNSIENW